MPDDKSKTKESRRGFLKLAGSIRLGNPPQDLHLVVDLLVFDEVEDVDGPLVDRLMELDLSRIASLDALHELLEIDGLGETTVKDILERLSQYHQLDAIKSKNGKPAHCVAID